MIATSSLRGMLAGTVLTLAANGAAHAATRDADLIGSFQQLCTASTPDLATIDQRAQAAQLTTGQNVNKPSGAGGTSVSHTWTGALQSGPFQLLGSDTSDQRGRMVSCGLAAGDANGASFKQDLIVTLNLGKPDTVTPVPNSNMVLTAWAGVFGPGSILQLLQSNSPATPGIMVSYAVRTQ